MKIIEQIKEDEGFVGSVYNDSLGVPTIGYGTKLPLSKDEAELLLQHRFDKMRDELVLKVEYFSELPAGVKSVLLNMAYNLGVNGLSKFKKMWKALEVRNYKEAAKEMVDSKWYRQVGSRATRLVMEMSRH